MQSDNRFNQNSEPKPEFVAELFPHRSLSRKGFMILMTVLCLTCLSSGVIFLVIGAWPVFIFLGLDVLIVWLAFKLNYRAARTREIISVSRDRLCVQQISPSGKIARHEFNPFWTRLVIDRHEVIGIIRMQLQNRSARLDIGSFLNPADRESFAAEFSNALARVKRA